MAENNNSFVNNSIPGSGQPWRQQYYINDHQSNDITEWSISTSLPDSLSESQAIITKNRVYLLGGFNDGKWLSIVYTAPINEDSTLGEWTIGEPLPGKLGRSQAIIIKNRVYLLGGRNSSARVSIVYTAPINDDGTLGEWTIGASLPSALNYSSAVVTKNRIYLLGGRNSSAYVSTVYTATINEDGMLGAWSIGAPLPEGLGRSQAIITKNRIYLLGGQTNDTRVSTVYTASINSDGTLGEWFIDTPLPNALANSQAIVTKNRVYLLGGYNDDWNYVSTVYTAPINEDGTLGAWVIGTPLPDALSHSTVIIAKNRVYLLGGINSNGCVATVYTAPIAGGLNDYSAYYS